jgi:hypothetical protein
MVGLPFEIAPLGVFAQVVPGAERAARALHHDHVHLVLGLRPFDGMADVGRRGVADGVELLRAVEQQACDARVLRVLVDAYGVEAWHGCLLVGLFVGELRASRVQWQAGGPVRSAVPKLQEA